MINQKRKIFTFLGFLVIFGLYLNNCYSSISFGLFLKRVEIISMILLFIAINIFYDRKKLYSFLYKYRWIIYFIILIFCVINKFNNSSIGMYNQIIQPGKGTDYINPVFGMPRNIRSDEWLVGLPRAMSASYNSFGKYNTKVMAMNLNGLVASGIMRDFAALYHPANYGFYFLGMEYGESFCWSYNLIFGFAFWFELFLILTKEKKILSLFGAVLIWFSPFNMWWSICGLLLSGAAIVVLFYHFVNEDSKIRRFFFGTCLAIAGADYICALYPAWQVPMGFIVLSLMIWILISNKKWMKFDKKDWLIFTIDILFMFSIVARYLYVDKDYIDAIGKTLYPGARVDYGGLSIPKLFGYFTSELSIFGGIGNPCEAGVIFGAFPLGIILAIIVQVKEKGKNILMWCLMPVLLLLIMYCSIGLPPIIAKVFLMTNSTRFRAVDFLGVLSGILLIVSIGFLQEEDNKKLKLWQSILIVVLSMGPSINYSLKILEDSRFTLFVIILSIITICGSIFIITDIKDKLIGKSCCVLSTICLIMFGLYVNPLMVGIDAITSKPAAKKIHEIVSKDEDSKWIAIDSFYNQGFTLACGAPTINSTNFIPNFEMWEKLDPNKENEEVWNRYAHIIISLSDSDKSTCSLNYMDSLTLELSTNDIDKVGIKYIFAQHEIEGKWSEYLEKIYSEDGVWIYMIK